MASITPKLSTGMMEWDGGMLKTDRKMTDMDKKNPMNTWDPNKTTREEYLQNKAIPQVKRIDYQISGYVGSLVRLLVCWQG